MQLVAAILAALCLAYFQDVSAEIKVLQKSHVDLSRRLVFDHNSYVDGQLTYALCDKENPRADEIKCTVIREKKPYGDESYLCDVTLKRATNHGVKFSPDLKVIPFGKNNVALTMVEVRYEDVDSHLNFTTVQMENCKVGEVAIDTKVPISFYDFKVIGHSDSYDVFYDGHDVASCNGKMCKATINADGKLVNGPIPSIKGTAHYEGLIKPILPLDDNISKHGYFYFVKDGKDFVYKLLKNDGTEKSLARQPMPKRDSGVIAPAANNKLIGVCYPFDKEYKCNQYDFDGKSKLETTLSKHADYVMVDIYNLPNGGFYTASLAIDENDFAKHLIERIDSNGQRTGSFELQGLGKHKRANYVLAPFFYQNENKETCVSALAYDSGDVNGPKEGKGHLYLTSNCFTDADFSK